MEMVLMRKRMDTISLVLCFFVYDFYLSTIYIYGFAYTAKVQDLLNEVAI